MIWTTSWLSREWNGRVENETIVINTGPLILLDKIEALDLLGRLPCRFICPSAVRMELDAGIHRSRTDVSPAWLSVIPLKSSLTPFIEMSIDPGEAAVIQLALEKRIARVCLDDLRGRRIAKRLGLNVTGVLGLLSWAKELGLIPHIRPYTEKLIAEGGRYSQKLISDILSDAGE